VSRAGNEDEREYEVLLGTEGGGGGEKKKRGLVVLAREKRHRTTDLHVRFAEKEKRAAYPGSSWGREEEGREEVARSVGNFIKKKKRSLLREKGEKGK